ncbi:MAG: hypothetical protein HDR10_09355 [Lachnospiraceae bacterium]|nr:hypothetical protein [Lachnospiraceae bacterium]
MNKDKLILNNQTQIEIESASSLSDIRVVFDTKDDMVSIWDMLTPENLKSVQIQNGDGVVIANYENLILDSETSIVQEDGTILTSFHLREKTEVEFLRERVEQLENGQEVQDGAISDLGEAVSSLAEEGGLV